MRYWLLTNTTYGTWLPGDQRGSVTSVRDCRVGDAASDSRREHDEPGEAWEAPITGLARWSIVNLKGEPILLTDVHADLLVHQFRETASHRKANVLALAIMPNHFHVVVSVEGDPDPAKLLADFKAYGSRVLNQRFGKPRSGTWWTTRGSKRKLPDERAVAAAVHYVLKKQPNPLTIWPKD